MLELRIRGLTEAQIRSRLEYIDFGITFTSTNKSPEKKKVRTPANFSSVNAANAAYSEIILQQFQTTIKKTVTDKQEENPEIITVMVDCKDFGVRDVYNNYAVCCHGITILLDNLLSCRSDDISIEIPATGHHATANWWFDSEMRIRRNVSRNGLFRLKTLCKCTNEKVSAYVGYDHSFVFAGKENY